MATELVLENYGKLNIKEGTNFPLNFNIQNLTKPESTPSSYSKDVVIIGDKESNKILGQAFDVNITTSSFNVNKRVGCNVLQDNATVFDGGFFQLLKVTKTGQSLPNGEPMIEYIGRVKSDLLSFFTSIKDRELIDLNLGGFDTYQQLNRQNILDSFSNTVVDKWKYIPAYKATNSNNFLIKEWRPGIFAKVFWDEIHAQNGWQYQFDELNDLNFDKLIIPYTQEFDADEETKNFGTYIGDNSTLYQADLGCANNTLNNGNRIKYGINNTEIIKITNDIKDNFNQFDTTNNQFTAEFTCKYNFDYTIDVEQILNNTSLEEIEVYKEDVFGGPTRNLNISLGYIYVILRANGSIEYGPVTSIYNTGSDFSTFPGQDTLQPGNQTIYRKEVSFNFDVNLNVGDTVYDIRLVEIWENTQGEEDLIWGYGSILQETFQFVDVCSIYNIYKTDLTVLPDLGYDVGTPIYLQQFIPKDITQRDFIKSLIDMYKLVVDVDPQNDNKIIYKTRDKYYDDGKEINWTKKIDKDKPINLEWLVDKQSKKNKFTYKIDKDVYNQSYFNHTKDIYGEFEYDFGNDYNIGEQKNEIIFSPTPIQYTQNGNMYIPSLPLSEIEDLNIRILIDGGVRSDAFWTLQNDDGTNSSVIENTYPYFGHLDDPEKPSYDINFGKCEYYYYNTWNFLTDNNLFNLYHRRYISQLTKGRIMTAYFKLDPVDILNIDLSDRIFINDTWWNINRIIDYNANSNSVTKVELVTVDDGISVLPSIKTGVLKPNATKPYVAYGDLIYGKNETLYTNTVSKGFVGDIYGVNNNVSKDANGVIIGDDSTMGGQSMVIGNKSSDGGLDGKLVVGSNNTADGQYDAFIGNTKIGEVVNIGETDYTNVGMTFKGAVYEEDVYEEDVYETYNNKIHFELTDNDEPILSFGSSLIKNFSYSVNYSDIIALKNTRQLIEDSIYKIIDKNIWVKALSINSVSSFAQRVMPIIDNTYYTPQTLGNIQYLGIYGQTIDQGSVPVSDASTTYVAIWGGKLWERDTIGTDGGTSVQNIIDGGGWTIIPTTDGRYIDNQFEIVYDLDNDVVYRQIDERGNDIFNIDVDGVNGIDITDWGNVNIKENRCGPILNNYPQTAVAVTIINNNNFGSILNNPFNLSINNNNNNGSINFNNTQNSTINNNVCNGVIRDNYIEQGINSNANNGGIISNTIVNGNLSNNLNGGNINLNICTGVQGNICNGPINANATNGIIFGNNNNGPITQNTTNTGFILNINNNNNNGPIFNNNATANINIEYNINNGYIGDFSQINRATSISDTIVNK